MIHPAENGSFDYTELILPLTPKRPLSAIQIQVDRIMETVFHQKQVSLVQPPKGAEVGEIEGLRCLAVETMLLSDGSYPLLTGKAAGERSYTLRAVAPVGDEFFHDFLRKHLIGRVVTALGCAETVDQWQFGFSWENVSKKFPAYGLAVVKDRWVQAFANDDLAYRR